MEQKPTNPGAVISVLLGATGALSVLYLVNTGANLTQQVFVIIISAVFLISGALSLNS